MLSVIQIFEIFQKYFMKYLRAKIHEILHHYLRRARLRVCIRPEGGHFECMLMN